MITDPWFYRRPELVRKYVTFCGDTLFSRMVFLGQRRIGKTSFFMNDLSPSLIEAGMLPIYVSMWGNKGAPHAEFAEQLAFALDELSKEGAVKKLLNTQIRKLAIGNHIAKVELEFTPSVATDIDLNNIKSLLKQIIAKSNGSKVVLILDEFQHLVTSKSFENFQYALRTMLDTIGTQITVIYTGSSRTGIRAAFEDPKLPFYQSATIQEFPRLDDGFVSHCVQRLDNAYDIKIDKLELTDFWNEIDHSPHWIINLMREVVEKKMTNKGFSLGTSIEFIREAIKEEEKHSEILQSLSKTDMAVFLLRCSGKGIYNESAFEYIKSIGGKATRSSVQVADKKLQTKGLMTVLPNKKVITEVYGLVSAVKNNLTTSNQ
ncbi:ATP-binding protein [Aliivibrio fischeri]|uniref:ATP-binding protein n=1 Tax=Aliivibrio fischeri TaxID=668 RepID=UPI0012D94DF1|nr:ATP-binding protein [Aliivibrio fischeri]MUJ20433.1 hypothetical protein [Aliivibrio fischeri]